MLGIERVIEQLQSDTFRANAEVGKVEFVDPLSEIELAEIGEQLPPQLLEMVLPLLKVTGGFEVFGRDTDGDLPVVSVGFRNFLPEIWQRVYPLSIEMAAFDELLYWDLQGSPPGAVFFVDHEGPWHCHAFDSLSELLETFIDSCPESLVDELKSLPRGEPSSLPNSEYRPDSEATAAFSGRFPGHYLIHDLRGSTIGNYFEYGLGGPDGIARLGEERLFAQRQPAGWLEGLRWWWNPNIPLNLPPVDTDFPPMDGTHHNDYLQSP